jgi:hypothetical protein
MTLYRTHALKSLDLLSTDWGLSSDSTTLIPAEGYWCLTFYPIYEARDKFKGLANKIPQGIFNPEEYSTHANQATVFPPAIPRDNGAYKVQRHEGLHTSRAPLSLTEETATLVIYEDEDVQLTFYLNAEQGKCLSTLASSVKLY